jgi:hypothetical protein
MTPAERQRRRRLRQRSGRLVVRIEVSADAREALIGAKLLATWDEHDNAAVQRALQQHVDGLAYDVTL